MVYKLAQHTQAKELRKRGFTYSEVAKIVGVSKSTVSKWFSRETWSKSVTNENKKRSARENGKRISLLNTARSNQYRKVYDEAERSAVTEFKHYKQNPLFIAGLMLYLSSGDNSTKHLIRISHSQIEAHRIFIRFAEEFLGVSRGKMRFYVLLYPNHKPHTCSRHWSKKIKIPMSQFHKYQVIKSASTKKTLHFGVGNTIIGGTVLKRKISKWIELAVRDM